MSEDEQGEPGGFFLRATEAGSAKGGKGAPGEPPSWLGALSEGAPERNTETGDPSVRSVAKPVPVEFDSNTLFGTPTWGMAEFTPIPPNALPENVPGEGEAGGLNPILIGLVLMAVLALVATLLLVM